MTSLSFTLSLSMFCKNVYEGLCICLGTTNKNFVSNRGSKLFDHIPVTCLLEYLHNGRFVYFQKIMPPEYVQMTTQHQIVHSYPNYGMYVLIFNMQKAFVENTVDFVP